MSKFIRCALGGVAVEGGSIMGTGDVCACGCDAGDAVSMAIQPNSNLISFEFSDQDVIGFNGIFGIGVRADDPHCRIGVRLH